MIKIRKGTFETNSSSTHSLIMCSGEEFTRLKNGELFIAKWDEELLTKDEVINIIFSNGKPIPEDEDDLYEIFVNEDYVKYDDYFSDDLESFEASYTLPDGQTVCVFGEYGYDG